MELEVRRVGGMETCFVSLPLSFIQTLQQSSRFSHSNLPPILSLQLRPSSLTTSTSTNPPNINTNNPPRLWHLAWSGSASRSNAIEVAPQLAECIGLPDHTKVEVKVLANLPKATTISIEPLSVDDWEILELNSQFAEETILKQVGIVHAEMKFPLWLEGHVIVLFLVVSTSPKEPVVQLVPGTEVLVAPKRRQSNLHSSSSEDALEEHIPAWGKLRVQDFDRSLIVRSNLKSVKLDIIPTVFVFVNRDTARALGYSEYQLVTIMSRENGDPLYFKDSYNLSKTDQITKENVGSLFSASLASRHFIGLLCLSNLVAHGHVMLPWSLRAYLGAKLHSWVYVREHKLTPGGTVESLILSPCCCKLPKRDMRHERNDQEKFHHQMDFKSGKLSYKKDHFVNESTTIHDGLLGVLSQAFDKLQNEENLSKNNGEAYLFLAWVVAQLDAMDTRTEGDKNSVVLGRQTLLHFEVDVAQKYQSDLADKASSSLSNVTKDQDSIGLLFLLTANFEDKSQKSYKFTLSKGISANHEHTEFDVLPQRLVLGSPFSFNYIEDKLSEISSRPPLSSLHWMATPASEVLNRLSMLISPISGKIIGTLNLPIPGHVLLYGPSGSGKTILASALAKHFQEHKDILAHVCFVSCSKLGVEKPHSVKQGVANAISEALNHAPSLLVLDDLDSILLSSSEEGAQESSATVVLAEYVADIIDECQDKRKNNCGVGPIAFMATAHSLDNLPLCLRSSGRFDFHIQLSAPAASERRAILKYEINKRSLSCHDDALADVSSKCDGYDGYDLNILIDRAVHAAASLFVLRPLPEKPIIEREDFVQAMTDFVPIAMRGITKATSENRTGWEDVGGLTNIKNTIQEIIEIPAKFPNIFKHAPLRLRSNVLLYGPPGCGKTHIVGAAAAAYSLRFISIKGPELLNKYIGASEQAVRDIFAKATSAAPCLLFFDEFDSIAPKRGHDNTGVTDRVVNQFLTELDGVEVLTGVCVFAATSRPDLLDAALLRPGRLDRLLFCDFPSKHDRLDILKVLSRKLPMASDVDLETVAMLTEGFTGADIQALLSDAQLEAVHKVLASKDGAVLGKPSIIDDAVLKSVTSRARPSVSPSERQRLYGIYNQFLDSKKPVATEARDAKGKKATLA